MLPIPKDEFEEKAISDINEYGLHILNVMEEGDLPGFSYSVGLWHTYKHPEILIIGLKNELAMWILNEIAGRIKKDREKFQPQKRYDGFIENHECEFITVSQKHYKEYVGWNLWLNKGGDFPLMQCVWPTTDGIFPNEENAPDWFKDWQPVLEK